MRRTEMEASALSRLQQLRGEHAIGLRRLDELARDFDATRGTVVRISGAIQVLEELLSDSAEQAPETTPGIEVATSGGG
jgi:hypothetical protein